MIWKGETIFDLNYFVRAAVSAKSLSQFFAACVT
jgi:hypothetical protein